MPDDFRVEDAEVVGTRSLEKRVASKVRPDERLRCKWCDEIFAGEHGLKTHLAMVTPDEDHPESLNPANSGLRVPAKTADPEQKIDPLTEESRAFHERMDSFTSVGKREPEGEQTIPLDAVEDLLDQLRMKEQESGAYVTCARMVEQLIQTYHPQREP